MEIMSKGILLPKIDSARPLTILKCRGMNGASILLEELVFMAEYTSWYRCRDGNDGERLLSLQKGARCVPNDYSTLHACA